MNVNTTTLIITASIWIVICIISIIIEAHTVQLVGFNTAIAAAISAILAVVLPSNLWWIEIIVFFILSLLGIIFIRPIYLRLITKKMRLKDGFQLLLNEEVSIVKVLDEKFILIKVDGKEFRAFKPSNFNEKGIYILKEFKGITAILKRKEV